jgi:CheY-like chemotaxis protein
MILVIDDEPFVRELTRRILERHGYTVQTCSGATEAIATFQSHAAETDLILLDMFMPGMTADNLLKALRSVRTGVPVVAATGFDAPDVMDRFGTKGLVSCIHKPFDAADLIAQVRSVLKKKSRPTLNAAA